jgi:CRISPR/Cas system CSM-associated protein Csm2 small subunit/predicted  nucleic acid-binding Zn-ribbon protein
MMGSFQEAMKKAGIASDAEIAAAEPETSTASAEGGAENGERKPRPERPPRAERPPRPSEPEKIEDKPCAKCGTVFTPKHSKHRLCPKCAEEHFTASKEKEKTKAERPESGEVKPGEAKPAEASSRPPAPRRDRPARPPRPAGERDSREHREPRDSHRENRETHRDTNRDTNRETSREAPAGFPSDYLRSGYFAGTALRDEVLDRWAREVGALLVARGLAALQMRAFYSHVKRAEASSKAGREFRLVREELLKMRPIAAARLGRRLIPAEFADFLDRNLELVKDAASTRAFAEHFQAVVGYTAGRLRK